MKEDFIYKTDDHQKHVAELNYIEQIPFITFNVCLGSDKELFCHLHHQFTEWNLDFPFEYKSVELAHPTDTFWNSEALFEVFEDTVVSDIIAYAIRHVYLKFYQ